MAQYGSPDVGYGGGSWINPALQQSANTMNLGLQNLAEQTREYNVQQQAQQESAGMAAGGLTNLVNEYNQAFAQAKGEYEQRYQQMLGIAQSTTGQQAADIRSQYQQQSATGMQNLQRLGLGNTTVGATLQAGLQGQQSQALNRLADQMQQTQLNIIGGHALDSQLAPDKSALLAALQAGQGAAGAYGGQLVAALGGLGFAGNQMPTQAAPGGGTPYSNVGTNKLASGPYGGVM